jgi:hypothetical protein
MENEQIRNFIEFFFRQKNKNGGGRRWCGRRSLRPPLIRNVTLLCDEEEDICQDQM